MVQELTHLKNVRRPEIIEAIKVALDFGDLSENFEYHSAKNDQALVEGQILELEAKIKKAKVISNVPKDTSKIVIGSCVVIRDIALQRNYTLDIIGEAKHEAIVLVNGKKEFKSKKELRYQTKISATTPLAQALLDHEAGDIVYVKVENNTSNTASGNYNLDGVGFSTKMNKVKRIPYKVLSIVQK
jgi:transcription elongation factor GreA